MVLDVSDVVPKLVAATTTMGPAWEKHLQFWEGDDQRGEYNDISVIAHHMVILAANGEEEELHSICQAVEEMFADERTQQSTNLLVVGLIEDIQNTTSWPQSPVGSSAFLPFLGPLTTAEWVGYHRHRGTSDT